MATIAPHEYLIAQTLHANADAINATRGERGHQFGRDGGGMEFDRPFIRGGKGEKGGGAEALEARTANQTRCAAAAVKGSQRC